MATVRSIAKSVTITHGLLTMTGELQAARVAADARDGGNNTRFTSCCPLDAADGTAVPVETRYICPNHPGQLFPASEVVKAAKDAAGGLALVGTSQEIAAVKETRDDPTEKPYLELHSHLAADLARHTVMGTTSYVFRPAGRNELYGVLTAILGQDGRISCEDGQDRVLIGTVRIRTPKLVMLRAWGDELLLQEIDWPENLRAFEPIAREVNDRYVTLTRSLVEESSQPFSGDIYHNAAKRQLGEFVAARLADPNAVHVPSAPTAPAGADDLLASLEASIAAAKAAKVPAKAKRTRKAATVTPIRKAG